jgi:hypothetical protein
MNKKAQQLGMNQGTAAARLLRDILWKLIVQTNNNYCCKCKTEMTRQSFSIEHVKPWLDSDDPVGLFFDLDNISFSHLSCNLSSARKNKKGCGNPGSYNRGCRCSECKAVNALSKRRNYTPEKRRLKYEKEKLK